MWGSSGMTSEGIPAALRSRLKLWITSRTVSGSVNTTSAIRGAGIRCAADNTICARRQVTTEPELRGSSQAAG